jgi:hypothetical protein
MLIRQQTKCRSSLACIALVAWVIIDLFAKIC